MFIRGFLRKNYLKGNDFRDICGVVQRDYEFPEVQRVGAPDTAHIRRISRLADHLRKKDFALQLSQSFKYYAEKDNILTYVFLLAVPVYFSQ
jgi:hypothetical protein